MLYKRIDDNKSAIDRIRPFEGEILRQLREYYRIGLTWTSNALEGNSLTEIETKILLEDSMTVGGKPLRDTFETIGHSAAYDYMFGILKTRRITTEDIKTLHLLFYKSIDELNAGAWRRANIIVTGSEHAFPPPDELDGLMHALEQWIADERAAMHPVRFAAMLHLKFVTIHPFINGNGRVARLIMNAALIQDGYMLAIIPPILRSDYIAAIQRYQRTGAPGQFCDFIAEQPFPSPSCAARRGT